MSKSHTRSPMLLSGAIAPFPVQQVHPRPPKFLPVVLTFIYLNCAAQSISTDAGKSQRIQSISL